MCSFTAATIKGCRTVWRRLLLSRLLKGPGQYGRAELSSLDYSPNFTRKQGENAISEGGNITYDRRRRRPKRCKRNSAVAVSRLPVILKSRV